MTTQRALPDALAPLAILRNSRDKAAEYYAPLLDSSNEVLKIGAWSALLDRNEVNYAQYPAILQLAASNPGIRRRAFRHFMTWWEYAEAEQVLKANPSPDTAAETETMRAELAADDAATLAAQRALYIQTGRPELLSSLVSMTERSAGWRAALPVAVDVAILHPHDFSAILRVLTVLKSANQPELIDALTGLLDELRLHPAIVILGRAMQRLLKGNPGGCLSVLAQLDASRFSRPEIVMLVREQAMPLRAEALDLTGQYQKAYAAYVETNKPQAGKTHDLNAFEQTILGNAARLVPSLPPDPRVESFVMTGFPRSGTTLLENALAAHPKIETFEEIESWSSMQLYLDVKLRNAPAGADTAPIYLRTRERYYAEIDRFRRKPGAEVLVDKMPIRAADAVSLAKLFPDKRFIFSIRHPFDVVLSCFKQQFTRNIAMEHFRTFEGAVKLYDFTMGQWFSVHSLDDPQVQYLRYDDLVTDFEPTMRKALSFLGVDWDPAVLDFARLADSRGARTPSYQKVRQGLSIGVQSSWRNYGFLFQSEAARPLRRWVEHFGYELV